MNTEKLAITIGLAKTRGYSDKECDISITYSINRINQDNSEGKKIRMGRKQYLVDHGHIDENEFDSNLEYYIKELQDRFDSRIYDLNPKRREEKKATIEISIKVDEQAIKKTIHKYFKQNETPHGGMWFEDFQKIACAYLSDLTNMLNFSYEFLQERIFTQQDIQNLVEWKKRQRGNKYSMITIYRRTLDNLPPPEPEIQKTRKPPEQLPLFK